MNRYEATLRLWKEAKLTGNPQIQLAHFRRIRDRVQHLPEGIDLSLTVDVVVRLKNWVNTLTLEMSLDRVIQAVRHGVDPFMIEESLKYVVQSQGGFTRVDLARFIFEYTLPQIRAGRAVWETLPAHDRNVVQVDTLLAAGLEEHGEVVTLVVQELQSLQGLGLKVASLLKDCVSPPVAFELWKSLRGVESVERDLELLHQVVGAVGHRAQEEAEEEAGILSEADTVARFGRFA